MANQGSLADPRYLATVERFTWLDTVNISFRKKVAALYANGDTQTGVFGLLAGFAAGQDYGSGTHNLEGELKVTQRLLGLLGQAASDPAGPVDPSNVNFGWSYDADVVRARMKNAVNQAGDIVDAKDFAVASQLWAEKGPTGRLDADLEEVLYRNRTIPKIYPKTEPLMLPETDITEFVGHTLQSKLDQWAALAGFGPSGNEK